MTKCEKITKQSLFRAFSRRCGLKIKHLKMKASVLLSTTLLLATATVPNALAFTEANTGYNQDGISVNIKQIKELANNNLLVSDATPSQALAQTLASLVSHDPSGDQGNFTEVLDATDVLHYFYPNYTAEQLKGATITPAQGAQWLHSKGYEATIIDRALTTDEIKKHLDNSEPIVTVLQNQNAQDWLDSNYAGVLYAHDDVETGTAEGKLHASFIKTVNYGEATLTDGTEAQAFQFPDLKNTPDPTQSESSFKWVSTITGIKRDPSWTNAQTIEGDKAKGVFAHKTTSSGNQSQVDFTDPEITALLNKYPQNNTVKTTKLAAVSLINLYEDKTHQKTVQDLESFLKIKPTANATSQGIVDWYKYLGFDFDVVKGRASMALTKAINDSGRLYLTLFKAKDNKNPDPNTAIIGAGYLNNTFSGYSPYWYALKLGENVVPFYDVPLTADGMKKQQEMAKTFKYTLAKKVVSSPFSKTDYDEDESIYNIRLKGTPDDSGITIPPTESEDTPQPTSDVKPTTHALYTKEPDFHVRETQGQQPWCSEFTNAAEVNTALKAPLDDTETQGAITSAKKIMQLDRPGVSDSDLENLAGTSVEHVLQVIQDNYHVTADFEMRSLSFAEVKKEIDAGGIVQMDGNNSESTDPPGTGDNLGHSVAIVGYVMPASGNQTPYYVVWNPWWKETFYLSSAAKTYTLGGIKYKWTRSWHNWRKITGVSRAAKPLDPSLGKQKVMGTANPEASIQNKSETSDILDTNVARYGSPHSILDVFKTGNSYWYAYRKDNKMIQLGISQAATEEENRSNNAAGKFIDDFNTLSTLQIALVKSGAVGIPLSAIAVICAIVGIGQITKGIIKAVEAILGLFGVKASATDFANNISKYSRNINDLNDDFYNACKKQ